ncbi:hypothetical protein OS187_13920, partial [Xanthomonadaceae bacterium JHOS43]|nr:hypothetical protein [Xanthomonadaceae bacterium JHOS43]
MAPRCDLLFASGLTLGVVAALGLPQAVPGWVCWSLVATGSFVVLRLPRWRLLSGLCIGSGGAVLVAVWTMDARLPVA